MATDADQNFMRRALLLAERGLYTTTPNPRVGCVIVYNGNVVGEGWHAYAGGPHAEIVALRDAGASTHGATLYVTLEPCHHHGRTPPCDAALIEAGIKRVVTAMRDPDKRTGGQGLALLSRAGIAVECGVLEQEARDLNIGFVSRHTRGRPWVRMKIAASLDGKTALANGASRWITGAKARADGHHWRARACAILTGIGTVRDDDPELTVRDVQTSRQPLRVIVDSRLETPLDAKILERGNVLIVAAVTDTAKAAEFRSRGAEVIVLPNVSGKVDLPALLTELGKRQINELHVEAGHKLNGSLISENCADELLVYYAPCLLGSGARSMAELSEVSDLDARRRLTIQDTRSIGDDVRVIARFAG